MDNESLEKKLEQIESVFTLQNIIDLLIDYSVVHYNVDTHVLFNTYLLGYTDFNKKEIGIYDSVDYTTKRQTIIHEFLHALKDKYNIPDNEEETETEGKLLYKKLYLKKD